MSWYEHELNEFDELMAMLLWRLLTIRNSQIAGRTETNWDIGRPEEQARGRFMVWNSVNLFRDRRFAIASHNANDDPGYRAAAMGLST